MVENSLISIITPCYNSAQFLKETIDSVLRQSYSYFEWIIVNDGSTDDTELIIMSYKDERIRYYKQENKGQCAASNLGLSLAKGDYIKFFDADDVMNSIHLETQIKKLNGRKDALASCAWGHFYDNNYRSAQFEPQVVWKDMKPLDWLKESLRLPTDMMGAWLWLIPAELLKRSGGWDERLSMNNDFEFTVRLLLSAKDVLFAEKALMYYRSGNPSSLSATTSESVYKAAFLSTQVGCNQLLRAENSPNMKLLCANRYQKWVFRIFPDYPEVVRLFETEIKKLGGSNIRLEGGVIFSSIARLFGWKLAKRLQSLFYKIV